MKTHDWPCNRRHNLFSIRACRASNDSIAQAASFIDQADTHVRNRREQADSQIGDHTTL
jgi:hypothetical protein